MDGQVLRSISTISNLPNLLVDEDPYQSWGSLHTISTKLSYPDRFDDFGNWKGYSLIEIDQIIPSPNSLDTPQEGHFLEKRFSKEVRKNLLGDDSGSTDLDSKDEEESDYTQAEKVGEVQMTAVDAGDENSEVQLQEAEVAEIITEFYEPYEKSDYTDTVKSGLVHDKFAFTGSDFSSKRRHGESTSYVQRSAEISASAFDDDISPSVEMNEKSYTTDTKAGSVKDKFAYTGSDFSSKYTDDVLKESQFDNIKTRECGFHELETSDSSYLRSTISSKQQRSETSLYTRRPSGISASHFDDEISKSEVPHQRSSEAITRPIPSLGRNLSYQEPKRRFSEFRRTPSNLQEIVTEDQLSYDFSDESQIKQYKVISNVTFDKDLTLIKSTNGFVYLESCFDYHMDAGFCHDNDSPLIYCTSQFENIKESGSDGFMREWTESMRYTLLINKIRYLLVGDKLMDNYFSRPISEIVDEVNGQISPFPMSSRAFGADDLFLDHAKRGSDHSLKLDGLSIPEFPSDDEMLESDDYLPKSPMFQWDKPMPSGVVEIKDSGVHFKRGDSINNLYTAEPGDTQQKPTIAAREHFFEKSSPIKALPAASPIPQSRFAGTGGTLRKPTQTVFVPMRLAESPVQDEPSSFTKTEPTSSTSGWAAAEVFAPIIPGRNQGATPPRLKSKNISESTEPESISMVLSSTENSHEIEEGQVPEITSLGVSVPPHLSGAPRGPKAPLRKKSHQAPFPNVVQEVEHEACEISEETSSSGWAAGKVSVSAKRSGKPALPSRRPNQSIESSLKSEASNTHEEDEGMSKTSSSGWAAENVSLSTHRSKEYNSHIPPRPIEPLVASVTQNFNELEEDESEVTEPTSSYGWSAEKVSVSPHRSRTREYVNASYRPGEPNMEPLIAQCSNGVEEEEEEVYSSEVTDQTSSSGWAAGKVSLGTNGVKAPRLPLSKPSENVYEIELEQSISEESELSDRLEAVLNTPTPSRLSSKTPLQEEDSQATSTTSKWEAAKVPLPAKVVPRHKLGLYRQPLQIHVTKDYRNPLQVSESDDNGYIEPRTEDKVESNKAADDESSEWGAANVSMAAIRVQKPANVATQQSLGSQRYVNARKEGERKQSLGSQAESIGTFLEAENKVIIKEVTEPILLKNRDVKKSSLQNVSLESRDPILPSGSKTQNTTSKWPRLETRQFDHIPPREETDITELEAFETSDPVENLEFSGIFNPNSDSKITGPTLPSESETQETSSEWRSAQIFHSTQGKARPRLETGQFDDVPTHDMNTLELETSEAAHSVENCGLSEIFKPNSERKSCLPCLCKSRLCQRSKADSGSLLAQSDIMSVDLESFEEWEAATVSIQALRAQQSIDRADFPVPQNRQGASESISHQGDPNLTRQDVQTTNQEFLKPETLPYNSNHQGPEKPMMHNIPKNKHQKAKKPKMRDISELEDDPKPIITPTARHPGSSGTLRKPRIGPTKYESQSSEEFYPFDKMEAPLEPGILPPNRHAVPKHENQSNIKPKERKVPPPPEEAPPNLQSHLQPNLQPKMEEPKHGGASKSQVSEVLSLSPSPLSGNTGLENERDREPLWIPVWKTGVNMMQDIWPEDVPRREGSFSPSVSVKTIEETPEPNEGSFFGLKSWIKEKLSDITVTDIFSSDIASTLSSASMPEDDADHNVIVYLTEEEKEMIYIDMLGHWNFSYPHNRLLDKPRYCVSVIDDGAESLVLEDLAECFVDEIRFKILGKTGGRVSKYNVPRVKTPAVLPDESFEEWVEVNSVPSWTFDNCCLPDTSPEPMLAPKLNHQNLRKYEVQQVRSPKHQNAPKTRTYEVPPYKHPDAQKSKMKELPPPKHHEVPKPKTNEKMPSKHQDAHKPNTYEVPPPKHQDAQKPRTHEVPTPKMLKDPMLVSHRRSSDDKTRVHLGPVKQNYPEPPTVPAPIAESPGSSSDGMTFSHGLTSLIPGLDVLDQILPDNSEHFGESGESGEPVRPAEEVRMGQDFKY